MVVLPTTLDPSCDLSRELTQSLEPLFTSHLSSQISRVTRGWGEVGVVSHGTPRSFSDHVVVRGNGAQTHYSRFWFPSSLHLGLLSERRDRHTTPFLFPWSNRDREHPLRRRGLTLQLPVRSSEVRGLDGEGTGTLRGRSMFGRRQVSVP